MNTYESFPNAKSNASFHGSRVRHAVWIGVLLLCVVSIVFFINRSHTLSPTHEAASFHVVLGPAPNSWIIEGALTEACTCAVPCTCNFGEGPSPHDYCYALFSYDIRKGRFNDVTLDGLHFGATDLKSGRTIFIDERANELQREALRIIAARVILRAKPENAEARAKELAKSVRYSLIKQEYDDRRNHLTVNGVGEFSAIYILGLDKTQPVVVRNNTTWRIHDTIKAKTSNFRVKLGKDTVNTKNTNSNQGNFEYTDKSDFGSPAEWSCGACMNSKSPRGKSDPTCGM